MGGLGWGFKGGQTGGVTGGVTGGWKTVKSLIFNELEERREVSDQKQSATQYFSTQQSSSTSLDG